MRELNWVDIRYLVKEMKELEGGRIEKIYGKGDDFLFVIFSGVRYFLRVRLPNLIFLTKYKKEYGMPSNFCMFLRKHLKNEKIEKVYQYDCERIVIFELNSKKLIFKLFGKGNVVLMEGDKVVGSLRKFEGFPEGFDFFSLKKEEISKMLKNSKYDSFVKFLASDMHLGRFYAELLSGEDRLKDPREVDPEKVLNIIKLFNSESYPNLYENSFLPFLYGNPKKRFNSYNEVIDELFHEEEKSIKVETKEIEKFKHVIEVQKETIRNLEREKEKYKEFGDKIFSNLNYFDGMIKLGREHKINVSGKKITVDGIELDITKSAIENAEDYYKKYKKIKKKIEGAKEAIELVKEKIDRLNVEKKKKVEEIRKRIREIESKVKEWYQNFRWIKFDDWLAVGGKNAKQNEILIRKYLSPNDIVFHADIYGSPFVILKNGISSPEKIREYVAQFTLCYSRAWKEKVPVDVYWVRKSQITKEVSGEYVGFGAFLIKGKKNYLKPKLEWCIGVKDYKLVCGPKEYVSSKTNNFVIIIPGGKSRNEIAKEVRDSLSKRDPMIREISLDEFIRCSIDNSEIYK